MFKKLSFQEGISSGISSKPLMFILSVNLESVYYSELG